MIKTTLAVALLGAFNLSVLAATPPGQPSQGDLRSTVAAPSLKMPPICWIVPTIGCR